MVFSFFEGHSSPYPAEFDRMFWEKTLQTIWSERYSFGMEGHTRYEYKKDSKQVLLNFNEEGVIAGNFVGSISNNGQRINIFPKIFNLLQIMNK